MDRLFLDANIHFSAAYRADAGLVRFWELKGAILCSSHYAVEEARVNLTEFDRMILIHSWCSIASALLRREPYLEEVAITQTAQSFQGGPAAGAHRPRAGAGGARGD